MSNPLLRITDGTDHVDFLDITHGYLLDNWIPAIAQYKGDGVWQNSPLADGRRLAMRQFDNAVETFKLKLSAADQDRAITYVQDLLAMLEKAVAFWTSHWQGQVVWLEARGPNETNTRYAAIKGYKIDSLSNPYKQPFFNSCQLIAMDDFTLVIERDHWQDIEPGSDTCVEADTMQDFDNGQTIVSETYPVTASGHDIYVDKDAQAGWSDNIRNPLGIFPPDSIPAEVGLIFSGVTVPQGAHIWAAYLEVVASDTSSDDTYPMDIVIHGEDVDTAVQWGAVPTESVDLFTDYMYRKKYNHTDASVVYTSPADSWHTDGEVQYIYGLEDIVQEIVDRDGWVSGNALALFLGYNIPEECYDDHGGLDSRPFYSFDDTTYDPPKLHIYYYIDVPEEAGREATCDGNTYIANKHNRAQLTHIYYYDDSLTAWSGNLLGAAKPTDLLPAVPEDDDELYFGITTDVASSGPFDSLATDLGTPSRNIVYTYYYCTNAVGPVWTELAVYGNSQFDLGDEQLVFWDQPTNWVACDVNGVTGFWIRIVVDVSAGFVVPTQDNRDVFTVITPYLNIDSAQVPGEIAALARIILEGRETKHTYTPDTVMVALRSLSRGDRFTPFINISDKQNEIGIVLNYPADGAMSDASYTPTGRLFTWDYTGATADWVIMLIVSFDSTLAREYRGSFHAYVRVKTAAVNEDFKIRLACRSSMGSAPIYSEEVRPIPTTTAVETQIFDMGIINLGQNTAFTDSDVIEGARIDIEYFQDDAGNIVTYYYDLILLPVDEWIGTYHIDSLQYKLENEYYLDIDATRNPRNSRCLLRRYYNGYIGLPPYDPYVIGEWNRQSRGGPYLQANADQRLWFFSFSQFEFSYILSWRNKYIGHVYRASRYLSMRGNS